MANTYLKDHDGKPSAMRLMSMVSLLAAVGLATMQALTDAPPQDTVILYFLTGAFVPKSIQKFAEQKQ